MALSLLDLDVIWVILIMIGATVLFITQIFSIEVVSMLVLGSLLALNLVTPEEAVSGFSNPATITVAAMFVLSFSLNRTGVLETVGNQLSKLAKSPKLLMFMLMAMIGAFSAFMNNTGVIAVFLPLTAVLALKTKIPLSRWLIPISFVSQAGGVSTLIGTSTNLLVNSLYVDRGYAPITMFEMGELGVILTLIAIAYFLFFGHWILPNRKGQELVDAFELKDYITELLVMNTSPLIGQKIPESHLLDKRDLRILKIIREKQGISNWRDEPLQEGDILLVEATVKEIQKLKSPFKLEVASEFELRDETLKEEDKFLSNVVIAPRSSLVGKTLQNVWFQDRYHLIVIALRRQLGTIWQKLNKTRLQFGDSLLVQGSKEAIDQLKQDDDFIVFQEARPAPMNPSKFFIPIFVIIGVVGIASMGWATIMETSIWGCLVLLLTRCIRASDAFRAIDWSVIFLLAGMIPLSYAITKSGAAALIAEGILYASERQSFYVTLAIIYIVGTLLTEFISNNATATLLTPIAISAGIMLDVDPKPLIMAVAFSASTSFATPIGYQTNVMIFTPGGYKYIDFVKAGAPLNIIFMIVAIYLIPKIWPF